MQIENGAMDLGHLSSVSVDNTLINILNNDKIYSKQVYKIKYDNDTERKKNILF